MRPGRKSEMAGAPKRRVRIPLLYKMFVVFSMVPATYALYLAILGMPRMEAVVWQQAEIRAQEHSDVAWSSLEYFYGLEVSGEMTRTEAQAAALANVADLRHGEAGFFWVSDYQPVLLADPLRPDLVNTNVGTYTGPDGKAVFADIAGICRSSGEGFYRHESQYGGDGGRIEPILSYARSFDPWGWVVGTGVYTDQAMAGFRATESQLWCVAVGITLFDLFLCWIMMHYVLRRPLMALEKSNKALARGDIAQTIDIKSSDEIGDLAESYSRVVGYMNELAGVVERAADGDLTVEATPRSELDVLGRAQAKLIARQRDLIDKTKTAAASVAEAGRQLTKAAEQTAQATRQITSTIQQVARGASEQSTSLQQTAQTVEQLSRAIDQIAQGSSEQSKGVEEASGIVKRVSNAIADVTANARAGDEEWKSTAASAAEGARKTHDTVEGMGKIKKAMDGVSSRVTDLGKRSEEIGNIVGTIDDIAAQTNLLALNAAIEAARAGEQGRGFAVVADEVRKLAERSSVATKEIAALVGGTQSQVREAVTAMQQGSQDIDAGYKLANEAGEALDDILTRSGSVGRQVDQISSAAKQLQELSNGMVEAIERINHIVEQNAAATQQMTASSSVVSRTVDSTAAVAQENSASAEQVSASAEEMSTQVQESLAAAQSLAETAEDMERTVAVFKTQRS
jgi:methyl-accepting chemotaxis protein